MKLNNLKNNHPKNRKEIISVGLLGVSAFMGILIVIKVTAFFAAPARAENSVKRAVALSKPDAKEVEKHLAKSKAIADILKKKNLFAPPPPKKHPVSQVSGILGDEVLINGKWYRAGDKVRDAKIVAIAPTDVKIEWEGSEKVFAPISAASASAPKVAIAPTDVKIEWEGSEKVFAPISAASVSAPKIEKQAVEKETKVRKIKKIKAVEKTVKEKVAAAFAEDPLAWMGVDLPPKVRQRFLEQWNNTSDEEKAKVKEQWNSMPEDQKQQTIEAIEKMDI